MCQRRALACIATILLSYQCYSGEVSIGPDGIQSDGLPLDGAGVHIGQVEDGRTTKPFFDMDAALNVDPFSVFDRALPAAADLTVTQHGIGVASVLISTDVAVPGIAPLAALSSSAVLTPEPGGLVVSISDATNHVANQNGGDVPAINHSYVFSPSPTYPKDGSNGASLFMDWSSRELDVLHAFGLDEDSAGNGASAAPGDSFNGIRVAASERVDSQGIVGQAQFRRSASFNTPPRSRWESRC